MTGWSAVTRNVRPMLVFIFTIVRHKLGIPVRSMRQMRGDPADSQQTLRLRDEATISPLTPSG